ncbi:MAG: hypothetical protein KDB22_16250 [Planctomycetales bacterium]|nr:hypothetical protein [Planctomycetales bacterium]
MMSKVGCAHSGDGGLHGIHELTVERLEPEMSDHRQQQFVDSVLDVRFAFGGRIGKLLEHYLTLDSQNWQLSWQFKTYYAVRTLIPLSLRQFLQQHRNQAIVPRRDWYLDRAFLDELNSARAADLSCDPNRCMIDLWPDGCAHAVAITHDIESKYGLSRVWQLAELEEKLGLRSAWYFVANRYDIDPGMISELKSRGHEVGVHGLKHDGRLFSSRQTFDKRCKAINKTVADWGADGFRSPMMHRNLVWMQQLQCAYDSSCFDIDPFQAMPGGVRGVWPMIVGNLVELPCTLPQDHTLFVTLGMKNIDVWTKKYQLIRQLRGLAMTIIHPDYMDTPARLEHYGRFLEHVVAAEDAWHTLPREISRWWRDRDSSSIVGNCIHGPAAHRGCSTRLASLFNDINVLPDGN